MPNLPPGSPNVVNAAVTPTWAFQPPSASVTSTVNIYNTGRTPVYVGGSQLTQNNGLLLPAGSKPIELQNVTQTIYALCPVVVGSQSGTLSSSAVTVGTTVLTLSANAPAALAPNTTIVVGSTVGTGWEAVVIAGTATTSVTLSTALVQDHNASSPVYLATAQVGQVRVIGGVV